MPKARRKGRNNEERDRLRAALANPAPPGGIGPRVVEIPRQLLAVDPSDFCCSRLAMQLADEWVEYVAATAITTHAKAYHLAITRLCKYVDKELGPAAATASLTDPNLLDLLVKWELSLPESYAPSSTYPGILAGAVRVLIIRRDDHSDRPVAADLARLARGPALLGSGEKTERDEFKRKEKQALVRAAWQSVHATRKRLEEGWALAEQGRHPDHGSWTSIPDLLWGLAHEQITPKDIHLVVPAPRDWPAELQTFTTGPSAAFVSQVARRKLARRLFASLYPHHLDLHAFRILLMDATGHASEEVTGFGEADVEFLPKGVRLTLLKNRAEHRRHRAFRDQSAPEEPAPDEDADGHLTVDWPRREASEVVRQLLDLTARVRAKAPHVTDTLFVSATVRNNFTAVFDEWRPVSKSSFKSWLDATGVEIKGDPHIGRMRKSVKVEKAIVSEGRISAAADDHTEETFATHYAQGTTLRILSGRTIATAQQHWFDKALDRVDGPTVISGTAEDVDQAVLEDAGLSAREAEDIMAGQLDMGVSHCKNPYQSPYSRPGELCAVAPLRCLECRNAWILPSNLPQLLLFKAHLERLRAVLAPQVFERLWGQSWVNLRVVLEDRTPEEREQARKHIEAGQAVLDLPLAANTEFDA
ncbi:hypothetical protein [Streptomyces sp. Mg1]|uniref:hypothetical protein n=1 Tax=Streptomyces sp. Mg1 TaxID=465541 RepID=UPI00017F16B0|nr:hypothetical protein [Streptomyces sp. Mg1]AKL66098.1 hypothetical protein M444_12545 [Streptomyces sp. Mg1]